MEPYNQRKKKPRSTVLMAALTGSLALATFTPAPAQAAELAEATPSSGAADDEAAREAELVKKTLNPIASQISVPFQNNWDFGLGPSDAVKYTMNFQPVIPFSLNQDWNMISRTILPTIYLESTAPGTSSKFGTPRTCSLFSSTPSGPSRPSW